MNILFLHPFTSSNIQTIAAICIRLDGLPLAIELAASRIKLFTPELLLKRLSQRFQVLKSALQAFPERQKTLYKTMTWSYDLLGEGEQWLLRQLSIFLGGATLETIEELVNVSTYSSLDVLSTLSSLLDQSMVQQVEVHGKTRFTLLETVRDYGQERLLHEGEFEEAQHAHALHYLALVEKAQPHLKGPQQAEWLEMLDAELGNLYTAMQWFAEYKDDELVQRFSEAFDQFRNLQSEEQAELQYAEVSTQTALLYMGNEEQRQKKIVANPQIAETPEIFTLKEARLDRGWTQTQLASMIGVSDRAYRAWENGDAYPSDLPLRRLAKVFGKKPEELGLEKKPAQSKTSLTYATLSQALQELVERNTHWAEAGLRTDAEKEQMVDMIRQLLLEIEAGRVEKVAERFNQVMLVPGGQSD